MDTQLRPARKRGRVALYLGLSCFLVAVVVAAFLIYRYVSADMLHKSLVQLAGMEVFDAKNNESPEVETDELQVNWSALREISPDVIAWIMIPDTRINYPIVQTDNNDYYLNHLFDGTPNYSGAIFLDYLNDPTLKGKNNFIYGHNLLDGTMFAGLKYYREQDFFDAHKKVLLATPTMNYKLEVVACLVCDGDDRIRQFVFTDTEDYESYVDMLLGYSVLTEITEAGIPDNIYCLVTCTDTNYAKRTVIIAKIIEEKPPKGEQTT